MYQALFPPPTHKSLGTRLWTGLLDWTTGLTETASGGERNKTILRFTPPYRKAGLLSITPSMCSTQFDPGASARSKIGAIILGTKLSKASNPSFPFQRQSPERKRIIICDEQRVPHSAFITKKSNVKEQDCSKDKWRTPSHSRTLYHTRVVPMHTC